jgi:hypothetical protein
LAGLANSLDFSIMMPIFIDGIRGGPSQYWDVVFRYFLSFCVRRAAVGAALAAAPFGARKFGQMLVAGLAGGLGFGVVGLIGFGLFNWPGLSWAGWTSASLLAPLFGQGTFNAVWLSAVSLVGGACLAFVLNNLRCGAAPDVSSTDQDREA